MSSTRRYRLFVSALAVAAIVPTGFARADNAAIEARLRQLEAEISKLRKEAREAKAQASAASTKATNVANAAHAAPAKGAVDPGAPPPPPPVFVSFRNGLFVETEDKAYSFKLGGRVMIDGGGITEPLNGYSNNAGFRQARLQVEGKFAKVWFYKLQYDFASQAQITGNNQVLGGIRDAYFGIQHPALAVPFAKDPAYLMVGSMFAPFSLDATQSMIYRSFIEREMAVDAFAPSRHVGFAGGAYGDHWAFKGGVFSTSMQDASFNPGQNTPATWGVPRAAGWSSTGGAQYVELDGRAVYAPIRDEHSLLEAGVSGRYHRPNDATGANDDQVLRVGNRIRSEANFLGQGLLGTPDLSCGSYSTGFVATSAVAGHCTRDVTTYGFELTGAYGPFDFQSEYIATDYHRNLNKILQARASGVFAPGGSSQQFSGYYVFGEYWLTGDERASAYEISNKDSANYREIKIKNPVSAGGYGALAATGRFSEVNLNSGPYSGTGLANMMAWATYIRPNAVNQTIIQNAGVAGGRQENVTAGLNWFPEKGVHLLFNWTHVLHVSAPLNDYQLPSAGAPFATGFLPGRQGFYFNGAHPDILEARAIVYW